ncbi:MAG: hypothetical protein HYX57_00850 [Chloroflexi bacterium]|nr:hypothetical protein [Chloroflexota bacterium]
MIDTFTASIERLTFAMSRSRLPGIVSGLLLAAVLAIPVSAADAAVFDATTECILLQKSINLSTTLEALECNTEQYGGAIHQYRSTLSGPNGYFVVLYENPNQIDSYLFKKTLDLPSAGTYTWTTTDDVTDASGAFHAHRGDVMVFTLKSSAPAPTAPPATPRPTVRPTPRPTAAPTAPPATPRPAATPVITPRPTTAPVAVATPAATPVAPTEAPLVTAAPTPAPTPASTAGPAAADTATPSLPVPGTTAAADGATAGDTGQAPAAVGAGILGAAGLILVLARRRSRS